jgi:hypothetical protein
MSDQAAVPSLWLKFDARGAIDVGAATRLTALLDGPGIEELVVMAHGWKNTKADATTLYGTLWANACANFPAGRAEQIVVAGIVWPAKAFQTDFDQTELLSQHTGSALAAGGAGAVRDLTDQEFDSVLAEFKAYVGDAAEGTIASARKASEGLTGGAPAALVQEGARAVGIDANSPDTELAGDAAPIVDAQSEPTNAQMLMANLSQPPRFTVPPEAGTALGLSDALQGVISGSRAAVARFLNQLTYYEMKKRAGVVGESLANAVLARLTPARPSRLHLVGHSFGGRLVTAAANALNPADKLALMSLTILQGAYSHNALARQIRPGLAGPFASVVGKPRGPITITHTHNDLACTVAYALASRIAGDIAKTIGDARDEYGAMGANGPQKLQPGVVEPDDTTQAFAPKPGKVNTFLADEFIVKTSETDAHNNITNPTVGRLLAKTILA